MIELVTEPRVSIAALAVRVSLVLLLGVLTTWLARRRFPALAHALGLVSLVVALAAPLMWLQPPSWSLSTWRRQDPAPASPAAAVATAAAQAASPNAGGQVMAPPRQKPDWPAVGPWLPSLLGAVWLAGGVAGLARLAVGLRRSRRVCADADPAPPRLLALVGDAAGRFGGRARRAGGASGPVAVRLSPQIRVPQLCGWWRLTILLPPDATTWSDQRLAVVLRHELAHAVRHDLCWLLLARVARVLLWPQPLAWLLERGVSRDCELAADELALATGLSGVTFGRELLAVAELSASRALHGVGMSSGRVPLELRIRRLLAPLPPPPSGLTPSLSSLLALAGVAVLSFGHPAFAGDAATAPWRLVGEDLIANRYTSLPLQRLQVVAFYDGAASPTTTLAFELAGGEPRRVEWITLQGLRKFVERIETREYQLAPGWSPTGRATIRGVVPDGVLDGVAYGLSWRDDAGAFHVVRSRDAQGSPSPNSVCAWPLALPQDKLEARTPQITDSFGRDAARLAICGAQVLPDGVYAD